MALNKAQYDSIKRGYEETQDKNRHLLSERIDYVYENVEGYRELDQSVASLSVSYGKKALTGDETALDDLKKTLADLSSMKADLLKAAGLPSDYLDPIYDCPDCQDTGYINGKKCHCFKQQMINLLYEQSNIEDMLAYADFSVLSDKFYEGEDLLRFQNAVKNSKEFVETFKTDYRNLYFYGTVGTGKSFLSYCIAKELLHQGHSVIYFSATGLFDTLARYSFDHTLKDSLYNTYEDLYNCDLVIIDDLGTEVTNSFVTSQLFSCLNERHLRKKATVISTNLTLEELRDRYSDRIFSRITNQYQLCKMSGPDIRIYKKRMASRK